MPSTSTQHVPRNGAELEVALVVNRSPWTYWRAADGHGASCLPDGWSQRHAEQVLLRPWSATESALVDAAAAQRLLSDSIVQFVVSLVE